MKKLPDPDEICEKADALAAKSRVVKKTRDHISWPGMVIFGAAFLLAVHAVAKAVLVA
jgi:hypothetical protein